MLDFLPRCEPARKASAQNNFHRLDLVGLRLAVVVHTFPAIHY